MWTVRCMYIKRLYILWTQCTYDFHSNSTNRLIITMEIYSVLCNVGTEIYMVQNSDASKHWLIHIQVQHNFHMPMKLLYDMTQGNIVDRIYYLMDKFSSKPPCFSSWFLSASYVMVPLLSGSASSNSAIVRSSICSSLNFIPFSSMHACITRCSSWCWIRPSPKE